MYILTLLCVCQREREREREGGGTLFAVQQQWGVWGKTRGTVLLRYNHIGSFMLTLHLHVLPSKLAGEFHADCEVACVTLGSFMLPVKIHVLLGEVSSCL